MIKKVILLCIVVLLALSCDLILQSGSNNKSGDVLTSRVASLPIIEFDSFNEHSRAIGDYQVVNSEELGSGSMFLDGELTDNLFMEIDCYNGIVELAQQYREEGRDLIRGSEYVHQGFAFTLDTEGDKIIILYKMLGFSGFCRIEVVEGEVETDINFSYLSNDVYGSFKYYTSYSTSDDIIDRYMSIDINGSPSILLTRDYILDGEYLHFYKMSGVFDLYDMKYSDGSMGVTLSYWDVAEEYEDYLGNSISYAFSIENEIVSNRSYNYSWELLNEEYALKYALPLTDEYSESYNVVRYDELYNWKSFYLNNLSNDNGDEVVIEDGVDIFFDTFETSDMYQFDEEMIESEKYYLVDGNLPYFSYPYRSDIENSVDMLHNRFIGDFNSFTEEDLPAGILDGITMDLFSAIE